MHSPSCLCNDFRHMLSQDYLSLVPDSSPVEQRDLSSCSYKELAGLHKLMAENTFGLSIKMHCSGICIDNNM